MKSPAIFALIAAAAASTGSLAAQSVSVSPARVVEGNSGTVIVLVPCHLAAASAVPVSVDWTTADGTAVAGSDYLPASGTITFSAGEVYKAIPVTVNGDLEDEADEAFHVTLSAAAPVTVGPPQVRVLIQNDEPVTIVELPYNSVLLEKELPGAARPQAAVGNPVTGRTVALALTGGTAGAGTDVMLAAPVLGLGTLRPVLPLRPLDDALTESDETFSISAVSSNPVVKVLPEKPAQTLPSGPKVTAMDMEGDTLVITDGTNVRILHRTAGVWEPEATLPGAPEGGVFSVTIDNGIIAADFQSTGVRLFAKSGALWSQQAFIPRATSPADARRQVLLCDDTLAVADPAAECQAITSGEVRVYERHRGGSNAWGLRQTLTPATMQPDFGKSASLWGDYLLTGAPGSTSVSLYRRDATSGAWTGIREFMMSWMTGFGSACAINGETAAAGTDFGGIVTCRRTDSDGLTWSNMVSSTIAQGPGSRLNYTGSLLTIGGGGAVSFYAPTAAAGQWSSNSAVAPDVFRSSVSTPFASEGDTVILPGYDTDASSPVFAFGPGPSGGTVIDDESVRFSVGSGSWQEGVFGASVTVTLSRTLPVSVSVLCTTRDGTAVSGTDYEWKSAWVTINAGFTRETFSFNTADDSLTEGPETFEVQLEFPTVGTVGPPGTVTITDPPPAVVSMASPSLTTPEGNAGATTVSITANLSKPAGPGASFQWQAGSGTATAGTDFSVTTGTVNVPAGATSVSWPFAVTGDMDCETAETLTVSLMNPVQLGIAAPFTTEITINNDDTGTPLPDSYTTAQNVTLSGVNVRNNDCSALAVSLAQNVAHGSLVLNSSGAFVYTPHPNFIGTDAFSYNGGGPGGVGRGIPAGTDLVTPASVFRWFNPLTGADPATTFPAWNTAWFTAGWNDAAWGTGSGLMGYGQMQSSFGNLNPDTDIGLPASGQRRSAYFRHKFNVTQPGVYDLELSISRDDSAIVYLNGTELVRSHEPGAVNIRTEPDTWDLMIEGNNGAWTSGNNEGDPYTHTVTGINLIAGENTLAISGHNSLNPSSPTSSDLGIKVFHLKVTGGGGPLPPPIPVTVTVTDAHLPPVLAPENYNATEDTPLDSAAAGRPALLANDGLFDAGGVAYDPILEIAIQDEQNGMISSVNSAGHFIFSPSPNFSGTASFRYKVRDKDGWSLPALATITINDDFPLAPFVRLNPHGSELFRSITSGPVFPAAGSVDAAVALKAGQTFSVRATASGTLGLLKILGPGGLELPGGRRGTNALESVPVPADGLYTVVAGDAAVGGAGSLTLLVNGGLPDPTSSAAAPYDLDTAPSGGNLGAAVSATMPVAAATAHHYRFHGNAGETVHLYLHSSQLQSVSLATSPGTVLTMSTVSPHNANAQTLTYTFTQADDYVATVSAAGGADYTLQMFRDDATHEYAAASRPLLTSVGAGHLSGPGDAEPGITFSAFGDYGSGTSNEGAVAAMVKSWSPDFLVTLGDHNYSNDVSVGAASWTNVIGNFYGEYILGRADNRYPEQTSPVQRFFPTPGNHDSGPDSGNGGELSGYFDYFLSNPGGAPRLQGGVHQPMLSYYKMSRDNMEFYFIDSDNAVANSAAASVQRQWLKDQLAVSTARWKFALWHHPAYSSGSVHGNQPVMQWGQDWEGLTAIFNGHEHIYERVDAGFGAMQFTTGLGGRSMYGIGAPVPQSQFRYNSNFGAMKIRAGQSGVLFEFRSIASPGGTLVDSHSIGTPPGQTVATGTDTWSLPVHPGQVLRITTETPVAPGSLTNSANPAIRLLDAADAIVATDTGSAADSVNASLLVTVPDVPNCPPEGCLWTLKVYNEGSGSGEYRVRVRPATSPDLYDAWAAARLPAGQRNADADPDLDGSPNLLEYLKETDPAVVSPPVITMEPGSASGNVRIRLQLPATWSLPVTASFQSSTDLAAGPWVTLATKSSGSDWIPTGVGPAPQPAPEGGFTILAPVEGRQFFRLAVSLE